MNLPTHKSQAGYVLLLLLVSLMGIGGLAISGYTQGVKKEAELNRFLHNQRVLNEAKQALLHYTFNYPVISPTNRGPGRLPCPDTDNDGLSNASTFCIFSATAMIGRFPWDHADLNFYDARDASGERLWYAVSNNFANTGPAIINSDTVGTITIRDSSGKIMYDGASNGIAAVIIAPGPAIGRNGVAQDRAADVNDPDNYLDVFAGFDNATFTNGSSVDGFLLGSIINQTDSAITVNDQFILVTAKEIKNMAERAVLGAYRTALQNYDQRIDTDLVAGTYLPWLYNYQVNPLGGGYPELDDYSADADFATELANVLTNFGRVPSMYGNYFAEQASEAIESKLGFSLTSPLVPVNFVQTSPSAGAGTFSFVSGANLLDQVSTDPLINVKFVDTTLADDIVRLEATVVVNNTVGETRFFWDEPVGDGWIECANSGSAAAISDCNRDGGGVNNAGGPNISDSQILQLQSSIDLDTTLGANFDLTLSGAPVILVTNSADGSQHATIQASFAGSDVVSSAPIAVIYNFDSLYGPTDPFFVSESSGTLNTAELNQSISLRYYPELPKWVFDNRWFDSVQMAYANNYRPDVATNCTEGAGAPAGCLEIRNWGDNQDDKISLVVIAGEHDWIDEGADNLFNDTGDVFDLENENIDNIFDAHAQVGNDKIMVIDEL